jgi:hypothetical protein
MFHLLLRISLEAIEVSTKPGKVQLNGAAWFGC